MKLFMATNSLTARIESIKMLIKAVTTALNNTDFEVFVIFDGKKEELNIDPKVNILEHRHRLYNIFEKSHLIDIGSNWSFAKFRLDTRFGENLLRDFPGDFV